MILKEKSKKRQHRFIPAYTPEGNGICERINVIILEMLRMHKGKSIKKTIRKILF